MSKRKRQFMDCHVLCGTVGAHTRTEGCILAAGLVPQDVLDNGLDFDPIIKQAAENDAQRTHYEVVEVEAHHQLARDVLTMAASGGMPDTYWHSDTRISRACEVLGITPDQAREMADDLNGND